MGEIKIRYKIILVYYKIMELLWEEITNRKLWSCEENRLLLKRRDIDLIKLLMPTIKGLGVVRIKVFTHICLGFFIRNGKSNQFCDGTISILDDNYYLCSINSSLFTFMPSGKNVINERFYLVDGRDGLKQFMMTLIKFKGTIPNKLK